MERPALFELESCSAQHSGALAALRLLNSYNHLLTPPETGYSRIESATADMFRPHPEVFIRANVTRGPYTAPDRDTRECVAIRDIRAHNVMGLLTTLPPPPQPTCLQPYCQHSTSRSTPILSGTICENEVRRRGEKRPIPPELKDEKYFERRRRNNQAAKKSRDARRIREDQIAWRACLLEQENASLRAHVSALRQEALALRALLAARDAPAPPAQPAPSSTTD